MRKNTKLSKLAWMQAGFRALTQQGLSCVKAEILARELNVSKGSFYWHFKNIDALKVTMLEHWQEAATQDIMQQVHDTDIEPRRQLENLLKLVTDSADGSAYGGVGVEAAIREWARTSKQAQTLVIKVDAVRLDFVKCLLMATGQSNFTANRNSNLIYSSLIGMQHLGHQDSVKPQQDLLHLLSLVLASTL
jgi:AcrR family transcriptional regulator